MRALIQRVSSASVLVDHQIVGAINLGVLVFLGIERDDSADSVEPIVDRIINYRIFSDSEGHMNHSLLDISASLLLVPQFTLVANTKKGTRPSFSPAANPELARDLYHLFIDSASKKCDVHTGIFGADMKVNLCNEGPVTFLLEGSRQ